MSDPSTLISRYDITKIATPILSYYQKIVPTDRHERVKFINSIILNAPYLIGLGKRYAALLSGQINYDNLKQKYGDVGFTNKISSKLDDIVNSKNLKYSEIQNTIFFNLYFYPEVVATVMPLFEYSIVCPGCEKKILLSEPVGKHFEYTLKLPYPTRSSRRVNKKPAFVVSETSCPYCNAKIREVKVKYSEKKGAVDNPNFFIKIWNPYYTSVERGAFQGISSVYVDMNRFQMCYPELYSNGGKYTYATLDHMDYNLLQAIMTGMAYVPNTSYTYVFRNKPEIAGLEDALSPVLLALVSLLHTGSLRRGQEADAIIKSSPHIMLTPAVGENSEISTKLDAGGVTGLIMQMVKEIQIGDTTGIMYFPTPVKADKLFTDPRRTILEREIKEEEMSTMITTGLDASIFAGGTGIPNDPFVLYVMNELLSGGTDQFEDFSEMIVKQIKNLMSNKIQLPTTLKRLPVVRVDKAPGTLVDTEYKDLAKAGLVPSGPLLSKYNIPSLVKSLELVGEENRDKERIMRKVQGEIQEDARSDEQVNAAKGQVSADTISLVESQLSERAEEIVQELEGAEDGYKQSVMHQLQTSNQLLYAVVKVKLQELNNAREREAKEAVAAGAVGAGGAGEIQ